MRDSTCCTSRKLISKCSEIKKSKVTEFLAPFSGSLKQTMRLRKLNDTKCKVRTRYNAK